MTTQFVGMKTFRQNLATYTKKAQKFGVRFIILKKNIPILEVKPLTEKEKVLEKLVEETQEARAQAKSGQVYTQEEVIKKLGLW